MQTLKEIPKEANTAELIFRDHRQFDNWVRTKREWPLKMMADQEELYCTEKNHIEIQAIF